MGRKEEREREGRVEKKQKKKDNTRKKKIFLTPFVHPLLIN